MLIDLTQHNQQNAHGNDLSSERPKKIADFRRESKDLRTDLLLMFHKCEDSSTPLTLRSEGQTCGIVRFFDLLIQDDLTHKKVTQNKLFHCGHLSW